MGNDEFVFRIPTFRYNSGSALMISGMGGLKAASFFILATSSIYFLLVVIF